VKWVLFTTACAPRFTWLLTPVCPALLPAAAAAQHHQRGDGHPHLLRQQQPARRPPHLSAPQRRQQRQAALLMTAMRGLLRDGCPADLMITINMGRVMVAWSDLLQWQLTRAMCALPPGRWRVAAAAVSVLDAYVSGSRQAL
jgi:hypothetical protein